MLLHSFLVNLCQDVLIDVLVSRSTLTEDCSLEGGCILYTPHPYLKLVRILN